MCRHHYSKGVPRKKMISYIAAATFETTLRHFLKDFLCAAFDKTKKYKIIWNKRFGNTEIFFENNVSKACILTVFKTILELQRTF